MKRLLKNIGKILLTMILVFLLPVVNIILCIIYNNDFNLFTAMTILYSTNACYLITSNRYFKILNEKNEVYTLIRTINLVLLICLFMLSVISEYTINENIDLLEWILIIFFVITTILNCVLEYLMIGEKDIINKFTISKKENIDSKYLTQQKNKINSYKDIDLKGE